MCAKLTCHDTHKMPKVHRRATADNMNRQRLLRPKAKLIVGYLTTVIDTRQDRAKERKKCANDNPQIEHLLHIEHTYLQMEHINFQMIELTIYLLLIARDKYLLDLYYVSCVPVLHHD